MLSQGAQAAGQGGGPGAARPRGRRPQRQGRRAHRPVRRRPGAAGCDRDRATTRSATGWSTVDAPYARDKAGLLATVADAAALPQSVQPPARHAIAVHLFGFESDLERVELLYTSLLVQAARAGRRAPVPRGSPGRVPPILAGRLRPGGRQPAAAAEAGAAADASRARALGGAGAGRPLRPGAAPGGRGLPAAAHGAAAPARRHRLRLGGRRRAAGPTWAAAPSTRAAARSIGW